MARNTWWGLLAGAARAVVRASSRTSSTSGTRRAPGSAGATPSRGRPTRGTAPGPSARPGPRSSGATPRASGASSGTGPGGAYPGDFDGPVRARYAPRLDGDPDPGEIVWTWVPYEEDHGRGKDRPVLLVGADGPWLLGVMLTSKDHSRDARDEARWGRFWLDIGSGPWDAKGRDSEVRLDRVIRVDPGAVRREGAVVGRATFDRVVAGIAAHR